VETTQIAAHFGLSFNLKFSLRCKKLKLTSRCIN